MFYRWREKSSETGEPTEEPTQRIFEYIETFYDTLRAQKRFGYVAPIKYLCQCLQENAVSVPYKMSEIMLKIPYMSFCGVDSPHSPASPER